jgi:hypothetical protein
VKFHVWALLSNCSGIASQFQSSETDKKKNTKKKKKKKKERQPRHSSSDIVVSEHIDFEVQQNGDGDGDGRVYKYELWRQRKENELYAI